MKLHLPNKLVAAIMAACGVAYTLPSHAGDTISVNYYNVGGGGESFNITDSKTGTVGGVSAGGWTNVCHNGSTGTITTITTITTTDLKNGDGNVTNAMLTTRVSNAMWGNDAVDTNTVEGMLLRAYLDLGIDPATHYYIDFTSDYSVSSLTLYFSGDNDKFAPVEINGTRYIGKEGVAYAIGPTETTTWGDRTKNGSKIISSNNTFKLSDIGGGSYHITNVALGDGNRATLAGFQVTDLTDTVAWRATLEEGETAIADVVWEKAASAAELISDAVLTVTSNESGSALALGTGSSYHVIESTSGNLTLTGSNLDIDTLHAKQDAKIILDATLANTSKTNVSGYGTVVLTSTVTDASAESILQNSYGSGTLELNQKAALDTGKRSTFAGTLVIHNADTAAYVSNGGNDNKTGYDLVLGDNNNYNATADISSVLKLVLDNAGLYYAGNGTTIRNLTLNNNSASRLKVEHMNGSGQLTFAGDTSLAEGSCLTALSRWTSRVTFEHLIGNGTLTLQGKVTDHSNDTSTYTINSMQGFTGKLDITGRSIVVLGSQVDATHAKSVLKGTAGVEDSTLVLNQKVVFADTGESTAFTGTLKVNNTSETYDLQIGDVGADVINFSSLKSIELADGVQVYYDANGGTIKKVSVTTGSASWYTEDMLKPTNADEPNQLTIQEVAVKGEKLTFTGKWKSNINIEALSGAGSLEVKSGNSAGTADKTYFDIDSLQDFSGSLNFTQNHVQTGDNFNLLTATVDTGSGHDVTITGLTVTDKVTNTNTSGAVVNLQGSQLLTVNGALTVGTHSTLNIGSNTSEAHLALQNGALEGSLHLNNGDFTFGSNSRVASGKSAAIIAAAGTKVNINDAIVNDGTLALSGTVNINRDVDSQIASFSEGDYGYRLSESFSFDVVTGSGTVTAADVTWTVGGMTAEQLGFGTTSFENGTLTMSGLSEEESKRWFMNTGEGGEFTYSGSAEQEMTSIFINAKSDAGGNTPTLHLNTEGVPTTLNNITVNNTTANIDIGQKAKLNKAALTTINNGAAQLIGSGAYVLGVDEQVLGSGVSLHDDWEGRVVLSGSISDIRLDSDIGTTNSAVELDGVSGFFGHTNNSQTVSTNVIIGEGGLTLVDGYSNATTTFNGTLSGSGNITRNGSTEETVKLAFAGNVSSFEGNFINDHSSGAAFEITFNRSANEINAAFKTSENAYGPMTLTFGADNTIVNGVIDSRGGRGDKTHQKINMVSNASNVTFTNDVAANRLTISSNKTATFNAAAGKTQSIVTLAGSGALKVESTAATETAVATGGLLHITGAKENYTGAVTLSNVLTADSVGIVAENSDALSGSVINFASGRAGNNNTYAASLLAFRDSEGRAINGTVAGLVGNRGHVIADTLTINVASGIKDFLHRYSNNTTNDSAVLTVNKLVKTGGGTQEIGGEYTGARGFGDGLVITNGIDVQQGTLHMKTRGTVKANISVAAGATFRTSDDAAIAESADNAMCYNGKVTLKGTAENTATLYYHDGSTYVANGLVIDGFGMAIADWDKTQFIGGLFSEGDAPSVLTLKRTSQSAQNPHPRYIVVTKSGNFSGTVKFQNNANADAFGIIAADEAAQKALAGAVMDFTDTTNNALVAFVTVTGAYKDTTRLDTFDSYKTSYLTEKNLRNGSVAGLKGEKGDVYAAELTINTAAETDHTYGGTLTVSSLVKTGEGSQTISGTNNTVVVDSVTVNGGVLKLSDGAVASVGDSVTISKAVDTAVLNGVALNAEGVKKSGDSDATVSGALISVTASNYSVSDVALSDSEIDVTHGATVTVRGGSTDDVSANVQRDASLSYLEQVTSVNLHDLTIGSGAVVAVADMSGDKGDVVVSGTLHSAAQGSSVLNANLTLNSNSTLDVKTSGGLQVNGALTLGNELTLTTNDTITNLGFGTYTLFTGVTGLKNHIATLSLSDNGITTFDVSTPESLNGVDASTYFTNLSPDLYHFVVTPNAQNAGTWDVAIQIPEPTTATLSLLALAGLCARRRRK